MPIKKIYFIFITFLLLAFIKYNYLVYNSKSADKLSKMAERGQQLWQENNCISCHQLYGLGGYLGPDLTNIYSNPNKGENYIKSILNSGIKTMPKFHFTEKEKREIIIFLKEIDKTGIYITNNHLVSKSGWVENYAEK
ncbi:cytochrome c [Flavobacterium oreochromis]|uniref:c-type cytochrome n=1 Tax=Flavobacterium oreochromis TaxID=2906078 RepID=UPI001CE5211A|nr:cytochrome c [Flavobacterium oreochromis]QYS86171.1 cytochrome c [Flavobacterium oreochromis]